VFHQFKLIIETNLQKIIPAKDKNLDKEFNGPHFL
jgi:hypothetical protein